MGKPPLARRILRRLACWVTYHPYGPPGELAGYRLRLCSRCGKWDAKSLLLEELKREQADQDGKPG